MLCDCKFVADKVEGVTPEPSKSPNRPLLGLKPEAPSKERPRTRLSGLEPESSGDRSGRLVIAKIIGKVGPRAALGAAL